MVYRTSLRIALCVFGTVVAGGCGTAAKAAADIVAESALSAIGLKKNASASSSKIIALRLESARNLNAGENGQGFATVFRVYKLKDHHAFMTTPYAAFGNAEREKSAFGSDLIETREMVLTPGDILELKEKLPPDSAYLATVALFRQPSTQRWRFIFATAEAEKTGITLGLHACAMTATTTPPVGMTLNESALLSPARCIR